jgi:hypothetical protein
MTFDALFCTFSDLWVFVSAILVLSKFRIELGPLLRFWRVECGRRDDGAEVEIRGGNIKSRERNSVRRFRLLLSVGLGGLGELVAVVVAHRHGYGQE